MKLLSIATICLLTLPVLAQEQSAVPEIVQDLNDAVNPRASGSVSSTYRNMIHDGGMSNQAPPQWGIAVKNQAGATVDVFGQVPYAVKDDGSLLVPGFEPPPNTYLELVPSKEWTSIAAAMMTSAEEVDETFAPITALPEVVGKATDFLAERLCTIKARPSSITLVLMVGASGNILFAEASTDAGSEVTWDLAGDVCARYGFTSGPAQQ
jgi:hypothetical protein